MAEKEERIVFLVTKPKGDCPCQIDKDYCKETCWVKGKCSLGMTRQEAIERMAKALIRADYPNAQESIWAMRWQNPASKDYYLIMANAALNALLESK